MAVVDSLDVVEIAVFQELLAISAVMSITMDLQLQSWDLHLIHYNV